MFNRVKYGAAVGLVLAAVAAVATFLFAPPIPLGDWAVYARVLVALVAAVIAFMVVWFVTVASTVAEVGGEF